MRTRKLIGVLLFDQVNALDVVGPMEAFGCVTLENGFHPYEIQTWAFTDKVVRSESGLRLMADHHVPDQPNADILIIPGGKGAREIGTLERTAAWLQCHADRFGRIISVCTGAYILAASGLVDGRRLSTHWGFAKDLQARFPNVSVSAEQLFLRDGRFCSSGGITSGIDLALDLIDSDFGHRAAMQVAREMVVFLRRSGNQSQFSAPLKAQSSAPARLREVVRWAAHNLNANLSVEMMAAKAGLSSRQFSRSFRDSYGLPPASYIKRLRLDAGRGLLGPGITTTQVAHTVGFGSADGFRRAFEAQFGVSPVQYQSRFATNQEMA
ncbi:MAG: DJ-1/PfpI family protein [Parvularculaceae bacterium]